MKFEVRRCCVFVLKFEIGLLTVLGGGIASRFDIADRTQDRASSNLPLTRLVFQPCHLWSNEFTDERRVPQQKMGVTGLVACDNLCNYYQGSEKFGICVPFVGCRCLSRGWFKIFRWLGEIWYDPKFVYVPAVPSPQSYTDEGYTY